MNKALFLDRDGIVNQVVMRGSVIGSPRSLKELVLVPETILLAKEARRLGFLTILVTNQPDVERGLMSLNDLEEIHQAIAAAVPLDRIEVCTSADDKHLRRKPNPGMILDSAKDLGIDLSASWFLGDSWRDLEAGRRAGVKTALLQTEYNRPIHGQGIINILHPLELSLCAKHSKQIHSIKTSS